MRLEGQFVCQLFVDSTCIGCPPPGGRCGPGNPCDPTSDLYCCSPHGWCGNTKAHCKRAVTASTTARATTKRCALGARVPRLLPGTQARAALVTSLPRRACPPSRRPAHCPAHEPLSFPHPYISGAPGGGGHRGESGCRGGAGAGQGGAGGSDSSIGEGHGGAGGGQGGAKRGQLGP